MTIHLSKMIGKGKNRAEKIMRTIHKSSDNRIELLDQYYETLDTVHYDHDRYTIHNEFKVTRTIKEIDNKGQILSEEKQIMY
jgi:Mg/Co/Ni transporter MgtE